MTAHSRPARTPSLIVAAVCASLLLAACGKAPEAKGDAKADPKSDPKAAAAAPGKAPPSLLLGGEDLITLASASLASGPSITGSVQPERRADLRAEVPAVVLQVLKESGDSVRRGDLLVRMDDTAIRDALASAEASVRASTQALDQANRQFERIKTLRASGMASAQAFDDAETRRNNAQSDLEAARTRVAQARQQLQRTEVRAPFDGVVSDRKVSAGDTAQVGKELLKVIDPASLRLEGMVSADAIGEVKAGQGVSFRVNGYGEQVFTGKIRRVNPSANPTTRQVELLVDFVDRNQPKLAGLYAEGQIETASSEGITLPASALLREGDKASVWRVNQKTSALERVAVVVGERDNRTGSLVLKQGVAAGDRVIRHPSATLKDGQKVEFATAAPAGAPATPAAPAAPATAKAASTTAAANTKGK
ncbi:MAG: efflux RND transporter periplasmic adaptor subunit [Betaproteobacteria bacterium]|nr:efflux RND transporter periplasmic adaptor subunit [Betaproteobacteria bacterium]